MAQLNSSGIGSAGQTLKQKPFIISGLGQKAKQPGGMSSPGTNTITPPFTAKPKDQVATGNVSPNVTKPPTSLTKDASGNWYNPSSPLTPPGTQFGTPPQPTGNANTPSGATVNQQTGQLVSPPPQTAPTFPGAVGALLQNAQQTNPLTNQGIDTYNQIAENISKLRGGASAGEAGYLTGGLSLPVAQGRAQILGQTEASQEQALGAQQQAALQAAGVGQAQQGLAQTGLTSAAGLAKPSPTAFGQGTFNPLTGQIESAGGQYGTGPEAAANVGSIQDQTTQINNWSAARQSASNLQNQLGDFLQKNNINPSDFNQVNKFLQAIGAQTSSPEYQTFSNLVNDLANQYAQVLTPTGGSTTDMVRSIAQSMINAAASGQSIQQVLQNLDVQAQNKIAGVQQNVQRLQTGSNVNPSTLPNTQSTSASDPLGIF